MVELNDLLLPASSSLKEALQLINKNGEGLCFIVDSAGKLLGVLTDGDIRRVLITETPISTGVREIMNPAPVYLDINASNPKILATLSDKIKIIPLLNQEGIIMDYASRRRLRRIPIAEPVLQGNELTYVVEAVQSTWISSRGKYVTKFQEQFSEFCEMPYALAVSNGTVALHLALIALGIGKDDEVIVPDFTFAASINAIIQAGATPVLIDIDHRTFNLRPELIEQLITSKTKAIMPVHLYGFPAAMDQILQLAEKHNLIVIEDAAEALGSTYQGRPVGSFGQVATFSFFGNKTVTTGEGGMIVFRNEATFKRAQVLRDHGMDPKRRYWHDYVGYNYRLTNLQAAIGVAQMERVSELVTSKRNIAKGYTAILNNFTGLILPQDHPDATNSYWLYTIGLPTWVDREALITRLLERGVETRPAFFPLHIMPPYQKYIRPEQTFPGSLMASSTGLSLPSAANLKEAEVKYVASLVIEMLEEQALQAQPKS